jgi:hypothetical protein
MYLLWKSQENMPFLSTFQFLLNRKSETATAFSQGRQVLSHLQGHFRNKGDGKDGASLNRTRKCEGGNSHWCEVKELGILTQLLLPSTGIVIVTTT